MMANKNEHGHLTAKDKSHQRPPYLSSDFGLEQDRISTELLCVIAHVLRSTIYNDTIYEFNVDRKTKPNKRQCPVK